MVVLKFAQTNSLSHTNSLHSFHFQLNLYPVYVSDTWQRVCLTRVKGKHTHTHTHTSRELVTCSHQVCQREETGIKEGGMGDNSLTVWTLVLSCKGVNLSLWNISIAHTHTHTKHALAWQMQGHAGKQVMTWKKIHKYKHALMQPYIFFYTQICTCTHYNPLTIPQSLVRTSRSPTVRVYCSSFHVKCCCTASVHVKKAFLWEAWQDAEGSVMLYQKDNVTRICYDILRGGKNKPKKKQKLWHVAQKPCLKQELYSYLVILMYDDN